MNKEDFNALLIIESFKVPGFEVGSADSGRNSFLSKNDSFKFKEGKSETKMESEIGGSSFKRSLEAGRRSLKRSGKFPDSVGRSFKNSGSRRMDDPPSPRPKEADEASSPKAKGKEKQTEPKAQDSPASLGGAIRLALRKYYCDMYFNKFDQYWTPTQRNYKDYNVKKNDFGEESVNLPDIQEKHERIFLRFGVLNPKVWKKWIRDLLSLYFTEKIG
jgi:hypothetical protein